MMRYLKLIILIIFTFSSLTVSAQDEDIITPQDLAPEQGQFIEVNGVEIYFEDYGVADNPTMILLHGFGGSSFTWRDNISSLVDAGYRVVTFDRPPFGLSDKSLETDYTTSAQLDYMLGLMGALEIDRATLVGHSAGGGIISYFSTLYPERVDALVFVAGAVPIPRDVVVTDDDSDDDDSGLGSLFELAGSLDPASSVSQNLVQSFLTPERFVELLSSAYYDPAIVTDEIAEGYQLPLQITGWEIGFISYFASRNETLEFDLDAFSTLDIPISIIWGEDDTWVPISAGEALAEFFPNSTFITYPLVGHLPMEENPEQFNTDLLAFIDTVYE